MARWEGCEQPRSLAAAIDLIGRRAPRRVALASSIWSLPEARRRRPAAPDDLTLCLDRILLDVPAEQRREQWEAAQAELLEHLRALEQFHLFGLAIDTPALTRIAAASPGLRRLALPDAGLGPDDVEIIVTRLEHLTELRISGNEILDAGLSSIGRGLHDLRTLDVRDCGLGGASLIDVLHPMSFIRDLDLGANELRDLPALETATIARLQSLDLSGASPDPEALRSLLSGLRDVQRLRLANTPLTDTTALEVATACTSLVELAIGSTRVTTSGVVAVARRLPVLSQLDINGIALGPDSAASLVEAQPLLTSLDVGNCGLGPRGITAIAKGMTKLESLDATGNGIGNDGAFAVASHLGALTSLRLGSNQIDGDGALVLARNLKGLTLLALWGNDIGDRGAIAIAETLGPRLRALDLWECGLGEYGAIQLAEQAPHIEVLELSGNRIGDDGVAALAAGLPQLLDFGITLGGVSDSGLRAIARALPNLAALELTGNEITSAGARSIASTMPNLAWLFLGDNAIDAEGATALVEGLPKLARLMLGKNEVDAEGVRSILEAVATGSAPSLAHLDLRDNPGARDAGLLELTDSIDARGMASAYRRLSETDAKEGQPFGEAKLALLGDEYVGKTSLVNALVNGQPCRPDEPRTPGVNHKIWQSAWSVAGAVGRSATRINVWDFGGQEILRGTHRYFLTDRSIYLVILDKRREDDRSVYRWLRTIETRAPSSPILVLINKCDDGKHNLDVDFDDLLETHPQIVGCFSVSCIADPSLGRGSVGPNASLDAVRTCVAGLLEADQRLEAVRTPLPPSWVRIRDQLRTLASEEQVLDVTRFATLCTSGPVDQQVSDPDEQRQLLRLLHQMGVVVAHGLTESTLSLHHGLTLLDPNWLTTAMYALLADARLRERNGVFDRPLLRAVIDDAVPDPSRYSDRRLDYIIDLMQVPDFGLAFPLDDRADPPTYLLPEALPVAAPPAVLGWDPTSLRFRYRYRSLPRALIPRFEVAAHTYFGPEPSRWRTGCTLHLDGCPVLVEGDLASNQVDIRISGPLERRRGALAAVRTLFGQVHTRFPEAEPSERVPWPFDPDLDVSFQHLLDLEAKYGPEHQYAAEGSTDGISVGEVLAGVAPRATRPAPTAPHIDQIAAPPARVSKMADYVQLGTLVGLILGLAAALVWLRGQSQGMPGGVLATGATLGGIAGGVVGAILGRQP